MPTLMDMLRYTMNHGASDLHLVAGLKPQVRVHGTLRAITNAPLLTHDDLVNLMRSVVSDDMWKQYATGEELDFAIAAPTVGRFRINLFAQDRGAAAVFHVVVNEIPRLDALGLPPAIGNVVDLTNGLVLLTGPTGVGKSTTLAAVIDQINTKHAKHIVTLEDPVEYLHTGKRSIISQREVGSDTETFDSGLKAALRENADVLVVGELRTPEAAKGVLNAAETGMLVFATLHTNSAAATIDRLIDMFTIDEQPLIRAMLAETLAAVVSQKLIVTPDGKGRFPAVEILFRTPALASVVRDGNTAMLDTIIQSGRSVGMQSMDDSLVQHFKAGRISAEQALSAARDEAWMKKALNVK